MNPCRCGQADEPGYACRRGPNARCVAHYQARLSGPLLDRIDLTIEVPAVSAADLILPPPAEGSAEVAARVAAARDHPARALPRARARRRRQQRRARRPASIEEVAAPDAAGAGAAARRGRAMRLSARGYHRVLKLARTLADLDGAGPVGRIHLAEALSYRGAPERRRRRGVIASGHAGEASAKSNWTPQGKDILNPGRMALFERGCSPEKVAMLVALFSRTASGDLVDLDALRITRPWSRWRLALAALTWRAATPSSLSAQAADGGRRDRALRDEVWRLEGRPRPRASAPRRRATPSRAFWRR